MAMQCVLAANDADTRKALIGRIVANERAAQIVVGEPGIGKSWMLEQLRNRVRENAVSVCCNPAATTVPLEPLNTLLRELVNQGRLGADWLTSARSGDSALIDIRDALAAASLRGPYQIYIDDLQWADDHSMQTLEYCIDRLQDYPIRWFCAAASGNQAVESFASRLRARSLLERWAMTPLAPADAHSLLHSIDPKLSDDDIEELSLRSGANPLYLESLARNGGETTGEIRASLRARIDRLESAERYVLAALAVSIRALDLDTLHRATSLPMARLLHSLARCQEAGLVRPEVHNYTLAHQLAHDPVLDSVTGKQIRGLHQFFAEVESEPLVRAAHLEAAGLTRAAAEQQLSIALDALASRKRSVCLGACEAIQRLCGRSTIICRASRSIEQIARRMSASDDSVGVDLGRKQLDDALRTLPLAIRARCESAYYAAASRFVKDRAAEAAGLAAFLAQCEAASVWGLGSLYRMLGKLQYGAGMMSSALASFERGLEKLGDHYDLLTDLRIRIELGLTHAGLDDTVAALDLIEGAINQAATSGFSDEVLSGCAAAMYVTARLERFEESLKWGTYALAYPGPKSSAWSAVILYDIVDIDLAKGYPERALGRLAGFRERVASLSEDERSILAVMEATALLHLNRFTEASKTLDAAMRLGAEAWTRLALHNARALLFELTGDSELALEHAEFVMNYPSVEGNCTQFRLAAAVQVARLLYRKQSDTFADAQAVCESLTQRNPIARLALDHVNAYARLLYATTPQNAQLLRLAAQRHPDRFSRTVNSLEAAKAARDVNAMDEVLHEFEAIGSKAMATKSRAIVESLGASTVSRVPRRKVLSSREAELARHVSAGKTNAEIAQILGLSRKTVDNHISNILSKCGARSRVEIASLVIRGEI
jgi:DNA-binding NarL/FixJ family response regulator